MGRLLFKRIVHLFLSLFLVITVLQKLQLTDYSIQQPDRVEVLQAGFLADLFNFIFGAIDGSEQNTTEIGGTTVTVTYIPPPYAENLSPYANFVCCKKETDAGGNVIQDADGNDKCLEMQSQTNKDCNGTETMVTAKVPNASGLREDQCKMVKNNRTDGKSALTSFKTKEEWDRFVANASKYAGLELGECGCRVGTWIAGVSVPLPPPGDFSCGPVWNGSCTTPTLDICVAIPTLVDGDTFTITTDVTGSSWLAGQNACPVRSFTFTKGTAGSDYTFSDWDVRSAARKKNYNWRTYDGNCLITAKSEYRGDPSNGKWAKIKIIKIEH